jgi:hypothetical protein
MSTDTSPEAGDAVVGSQHSVARSELEDQDGSSGEDQDGPPGERQRCLDEAQRVIEAAETAGIPLRATGGVAVGLICTSSTLDALARSYADIDFVGLREKRPAIEKLFPALGYQPEARFNALHGATRMFFGHDQLGRQADIFLDGIRACHYLDVKDRLLAWPCTLAPADLLLSKLQVVCTNEKDFRDAIALLADHDLTDDDSGICVPRIAGVCSQDWGWWRTVTLVAARTAEVAEHWSEQTPSIRHVPSRLRTLIEEIDRAPKTRKWKLRAKIGERMRWHEDPEEPTHGG